MEVMNFLGIVCIESFLITSNSIGVKVFSLFQQVKDIRVVQKFNL